MTSPQQIRDDQTRAIRDRAIRECIEEISDPIYGAHDGCKKQIITALSALLPPPPPDPIKALVEEYAETLNEPATGHEKILLHGFVERLATTNRLATQGEVR